MQDLSKFKLERILHESASYKHAAVLGRFEGSDEQALLILTRRHFPVDQLQALINGTTLELSFANDIYSKFAGSCGEEFSRITVDAICPCTAAHIAKHSAQQQRVVCETPEMYEARSKPFIDAIPPAALQWVYNVLDKVKEADRIIFEDPDPQMGFILAPDLKWDQTQVEQLYCLALVHRRDLKSLRDLDAASLPLLRNLLDKGAAAIMERFKIPLSSLKVYLHYHPSYYHLHVHYIHANLDATPGQLAAKAHMLQTVIDNISTIAGDYYQRATLPCVLGADNALYQALTCEDSAADS